MEGEGEEVEVEVRVEVGEEVWVDQSNFDCE